MVCCQLVARTSNRETWQRSIQGRGSCQCSGAWKHRSRAVLLFVWRSEFVGLWSPLVASHFDYVSSVGHCKVTILVSFNITGHFGIWQLLHVVQADSRLFNPQ